MSEIEIVAADEAVQSHVEQADAIPPSHRVRRFIGGAALALTLGTVGGLIGSEWAQHTAAHVEIAGTSADAWGHNGQTYNELDVDDSLSFRRAIPADQQIGGEPVGARVRLNINAKTLEDEQGNFQPDVLSAYLSLFSDQKQITSDVTWAIEKHDIWGTSVGAGIGLLLVPGRAGYRRRRHIYDVKHSIGPDEQAQAQAYYQPERTFAKNTARLAAVAMAFSAIPASTMHAARPTVIHSDPRLAGTILANTEIDGPLEPAVVAGINYIEEYISDTNKSYNQLETNLKNYLATNPVQLPAGDNVVNLGFVTDRHCNTGMDRVTVALMQHYGIRMLLSGGDDDLNGSFSFESGCTSDLAQRTKIAHIKDDFIGGNHDDQMTANAETKQGITVLSGEPVSVDGLTLIGAQDPRTSRWGEGIQPSSAAAQAKLVIAQGKQIGETACKANKPMIAILHDPRAGTAALENGCGNITIALDGHTHVQAGPTSITLPNGLTGYQFTGGTSGGAPSEAQHDGNPLDDVTVGPLKHNAIDYIVSIDKTTNELISITAFTFTPEQTITVSQQIIDPSYFATTPGDTLPPK